MAKNDIQTIGIMITMVFTQANINHPCSQIDPKNVLGIIQCTTVEYSPVLKINLCI